MICSHVQLACSIRGIHSRVAFILLSATECGVHSRVASPEGMYVLEHVLHHPTYMYMYMYVLMPCLDEVKCVQEWAV